MNRFDQHALTLFLIMMGFSCLSVTGAYYWFTSPTWLIITTISEASHFDRTTALLNEIAILFLITFGLLVYVYSTAARQVGPNLTESKNSILRHYCNGYSKLACIAVTFALMIMAVACFNHVVLKGTERHMKDLDERSLHASLSEEVYWIIGSEWKKRYNTYKPLSDDDKKKYLNDNAKEFFETPHSAYFLYSLFTWVCILLGIIVFSREMLLAVQKLNKQFEQTADSKLYGDLCFTSVWGISIAASIFGYFWGSASGQYSSELKLQLEIATLFFLFVICVLVILYGIRFDISNSNTNISSGKILFDVAKYNLIHVLVLNVLSISTGSVFG